MYIPQGLFSGDSAFIASLPVDKPSRFSLDTSGVIGLLGGDKAVSAMAAVHLYEGRRLLGWYNNPGSFEISQRLSLFAKSVSLRSVFGLGASSATSTSHKPVHTDPAALFGVDDDCKGPKFRAAHSGTVIEETGNLAALFVKECTAWDREDKVVPGRTTQPVGITVVDLGQAPPSEMHPTRGSAATLMFSSLPIAVSVGTCLLSAVVEDWYASSLILVGILASGVFSFVLGSADLVFSHPEPAKGSPAGDGILNSGKDIVLLRGTEGAVNSITRGRFSLRFASEAHVHLVRWCSFLFLIQAIAQLLLIPQASLFGQIMFLVSLGVSALYNTRLSAQDKEKMDRKLLFENVLDNPRLTKYTLGTRTSAVVFILLVLQLQDPTAILNELLPNDTKVWKQWKATIVEKLGHPNDKSLQFGGKVGDLDGFTREEKALLDVLYGDARAAYDGYRDYLRADSL
jgi:hypothetical protein